jgi:hypothetical protein
MSGHFICDSCGYDGGHAAHCKYLRPAKDQWKGDLRRGEESKEGRAQEGRAKEIKSVGLEGPCRYSGTTALYCITDDIVPDGGDHGAVAQESGPGGRDDLLGSVSAKALAIIRG